MYVYNNQCHSYWIQRFKETNTESRISSSPFLVSPHRLTGGFLSWQTNLVTFQVGPNMTHHFSEWNPVSFSKMVSESLKKKTCTMYTYIIYVYILCHVPIKPARNRKSRLIYTGNHLVFLDLTATLGFSKRQSNGFL